MLLLALQLLLEQMLALQLLLEQMLALQLLLVQMLQLVLQLLVQLLEFQLVCCMLSKRLPTGKRARVIFSCLCFQKMGQKLYKTFAMNNYR